MGLVRVAACSELLPGQGRVVRAAGLEIALFNVGGSFYGIGNTCRHRGGPLGEGSLEGSVVTCPWHGWEYDVTTGVSRVNPAMRVPVYQTEVKGDDVFIELP
ncbi:MAG TPA: Rieske 2Fe-2S domain-containing protein [Candidatus Methylomirabilis sp.]|nr:Rieske 2Fe-2S domain-containing protein [Candidatus Methylomirabilis sp.]